MEHHHPKQHIYPLCYIFIFLNVKTHFFKKVKYKPIRVQFARTNAKLLLMIALNDHLGRLFWDNNNCQIEDKNGME